MHDGCDIPRVLCDDHVLCAGATKVEDVAGDGYYIAAGYRQVARGTRRRRRTMVVVKAHTPGFSVEEDPALEPVPHDLKINGESRECFRQNRCVQQLVALNQNVFCRLGPRSWR